MTASLPENNTDYPFLSGGGQMGELIRAIDWVNHSLGSPAGWPIALKQAVSMMLKNNLPVLICWGTGYIQFYNDAFRPINGESKHPQAMGGSAKDTYAEIWITIGPMFAEVMNGKTHGFPNFKVPLDRDGKVEDCYFDFSYSPIADVDGQIQGVLVICMETTSQINSIREYQRSEEQRKANEQQLQLLIDMLPASVVVIRGPELVVELINQSNLNYWQKTAEEVIGKPFLEILPDLANQPFAGQLRQVMATGEIIDVKESPVLFQNSDGSTRQTFVDYTYQPLTDSQGQRTGVLVMSSEITERVAARKLLEATNAQLVRSEARFKYLIQEAPVAIGVLHGRELVIESANEMILKIWGKPRTIIGQPLAIALPELEGQPFLQILDNVFTSGKAYYGSEVPARLEHQGTLQEIFFNFVYQPITDGGETTTDILIVAVDVTIEVNARKALQRINDEQAASNEALTATNNELAAARRKIEESETALRLAIDAANFGTWFIHSETREFITDARLKELFGYYPEEDLSIEQALAQITDEYRGFVADKLEKAIYQNGDYDVSYPVIGLHDNQLRWLRAIGNLKADPSGAFSAFTGVVMDITEQHLAAQKVEQSEQHFRYLADLVPAKISNALPSGEVTFFNQQWLDYSGMNFEDLRDFGYHALMHPDEIPGFVEQLGEAAAKGVPLESEMRFKDIDGNYRWHLNIASPILNEKGEVTMWVGSTTNIQRIKEEDQRKSDFIGMVSHELKTPLTSLNAYLQVLQNKAVKNDDQFIRRSLDQSVKQVKKMTAMINGFLNVSRLESGQIPINKTIFDIQYLFAETETETAPMHTTHAISFSCAASVKIKADHEKIGQVLNNFISNAVKYSRPGTAIKVNCIAGEKEVAIAVTDQGIGIKPADLKHVFERYFRAETQGHVSGFGIGLYLCAEIVKRHNGKVWAESEPGQGSTFYFSLPIA